MCQFVSDDKDDEDNTNIDVFNEVNSNYYDIHELNTLKPDLLSSIGFLHTNLASIYKHYDDLVYTLSRLKFGFQIIAITEHKIKDNIPLLNIEIPGYHHFIFDPTVTSNGDTGFYIKDTRF